MVKWVFGDVKRIMGLRLGRLSAFAEGDRKKRDEATEQSGMALKG